MYICNKKKKFRLIFHDWKIFFIKFCKYFTIPGIRNYLNSIMLFLMVHVEYESSDIAAKKIHLTGVSMLCSDPLTIGRILKVKTGTCWRVGAKTG